MAPTWAVPGLLLVPFVHLFVSSSSSKNVHLKISEFISIRGHFQRLAHFLKTLAKISNQRTFVSLKLLVLAENQKKPNLHLKAAASFKMKAQKARVDLRLLRSGNSNGATIFASATTA